MLYLYSPYVGHVAPLILGDLSEVIALGLLPCLLWSVHRLITINARFDFALVTLSCAGITLVSPFHTIAGLLLSGVLLVGVPRRRYKSVRLWIIACGSGVGLAAFFWLPALGEHSVAQWLPSMPSPEIPALTLADLLRPMQRIDLNELLPQPQLTLGLPLSLSLAAGAFVFVLRRPRRWIVPLCWVIGIVGVTIGLITPPFFSLSFPAHRLLGPITLALSLAAALSIAPLFSLRLRSASLLMPVALLLLIAGALPVWLAPRWSADFGSVDSYAQVIYEQSGYGVAALPPHFPLPTTLTSPPEPDRALMLSYQSGSISRLRPDQTQLGRRVSMIDSDTHTDRFQIRTVAATVLQISRAYFPGWQARFESQPIGLSRSEQTGLIQLQLPGEVEGDLVVWLGRTPIRQLSWGISWLIALLVTIETLRRLRRIKEPQYEDLRLLHPATTRLTFLTFAGICGVIAAFALPFSPLSLHARPGYVLDGTRAVQSRTQTGLELISIDLSSTRIQRGETIELMLAWRTLRPLRENYQVEIQLLDSSGTARWFTSGLQPIGGYPTRRWQPNRLVRDYYRLPLSNLIPGDYIIAVELYACSPACLPENYLSFFDVNGQLIGKTLLLPTQITVAR
ncbi:hypothetical protein HC928_14745 [bacterium]|nr:hypothetical protein [bacterium]